MNSKYENGVKMYFNIDFIKAVIPAAEIISSSNLVDYPTFSIDSRTVDFSDFFIALKGANVDGHDFILDAINKGAKGIILNISKKDVLKSIPAKLLEDVFILAVPDTYQGLLKLASAWRTNFSFPVVGITGSVGKTSTKEILANVLKLSGKKFIISSGNQNTAIGLSLNILRMRPYHEFAVFEMGINGPGQMEQMSSIAQPTIAAITTIGHSHMEGLGSLVDIAQEKRSIFKFFKQHNIGIVNGDQEILSNISYFHPIVKFGSKTTNQVQARKVQLVNNKIEFVLKIYKDRYNVSLNTCNKSQINNILAASAIAYMLNIPNDIIVDGVSKPLKIQGRFETVTTKNSKHLLINDCYNANPESMKAAILAFEHVDSPGEKIAVLGDMLELGVNSPFWHRQIGRFLRKAPSIKHVILVGNLVKWTKATLPINYSCEHVSDWQEALKLINKKFNNNAIILLKASRGMALDKIVTELT